MTDEQAQAPRFYVPPCLHYGIHHPVVDRGQWLHCVVSYFSEQDRDAFSGPFLEDNKYALLIQRWASNAGTPIDYSELAEFVAQFKAQMHRTLSCTALRQTFGESNCNMVVCDRRLPWYYVRGRYIAYRAVAADILRDFSVATIGRIPYVYSKGVYVQGTDLLDNAIRERLCCLSDTGKVNAVLDEIRSLTRVDPNQFDSDPDIINLQNGLYHISTNTLTGHIPTHLSRIQHPIVFDSTATCPKTHAFLSDIITAPADLEAFLEFNGYLFYRGKPFPHVLAMVGSGDNGKSKALEWVERVVGEPNVCHVDLQSFAADKFATSGLDGKCVDIMYDLPQTPISESGPFKTITGDATLSIEPKYQKRYDINNYIKLVIAANILPVAADATNAFYRRWRIIICDRQFSPEEKNPFIIKKIDTPQERSGYFNLCMHHLRNYLQRGEPAGQLSVEDTRTLYDSLSNPYQSFLDECIEEADETDPHGFVTEKDLYSAFESFCRANRLMPTGQVKFNRFIRNESALNIRPFRPKIEGRRPKAWKGIILRHSSEKGAA